MTDERRKPRAAVLISGGGTNLQAFIDATSSGSLDLELSVVVSSNPDAYGLERAHRAGIPTEVVTAQHANRENYDAALSATLDRYQPDLLILAGFMRILTPSFVARWRGCVLNIHPSLLPKYPGLDTHRRVLEAGDAWHGCTVHYVTEKLDAGPPIIQGRVPVLPSDTPETLAARVLTVEHRIYPEAAGLVAAGRVTLANDHVHLDGRRLTEPLQHSDNK